VIGANLAVEEIELIEFGYPPDAEGWIDVDNARCAFNGIFVCVERQTLLLEG
jgi:hypothetical protein